MDASTRKELMQIFSETRTIAVVGASTDEEKPSHLIPLYLQSQGYHILPVNPHGGKIFGESVYRSLADIDMPVDVVDVFRPSNETPEIASEAVKIGAKVLWLQLGIEFEEARKIAETAGLTVVMDQCMGALHGAFGLGPGPHAPMETWKSGER